MTHADKIIWNGLIKMQYDFEVFSKKLEFYAPKEFERELMKWNNVLVRMYTHIKGLTGQIEHGDELCEILKQAEIEALKEINCNDKTLH